MDRELNDSLISVIIPVYNIERYLDRCVDSVLKQTFQNTEVLLVDDGSTDRSGLLCDEWAGKDPRVRVIHKPNGGLSDARNAGIAAAGGAYLAFVDGDDYLDPDMIRKLYAALKSNDADLSICNFLYVDEAGAPIPEKTNYLPIGDEVLTGSEILRRISQPDRKSWYYVPAWNKLYKRTLFQDLRFAYGKIHEDEFLIHHLLGKCEKAACIRDAGYCYVQRAGSIMGKRTGKSNLHAAEAYLDRALFCHGKGLPEYAGFAYWKAAMFLADAFMAEHLTPPLKKERLDALRCFRANRSLRTTCSGKEKLQTLFVAASPGLYGRIFHNPLRKQWKEHLRKGEDA